MPSKGRHQPNPHVVVSKHIFNISIPPAVIPSLVIGEPLLSAIMGLVSGRVTSDEVGQRDLPPKPHDCGVLSCRETMLDFCDLRQRGGTLEYLNHALRQPVCDW